MTTRVDDARAELDRGEVPFTDGPQAEDETQRPITEAGLVRGRDDRRVGERRGLDGILVREVGADEEPPFGGEGIGVGGQSSHGLVVAP